MSRPLGEALRVRLSPEVEAEVRRRAGTENAEHGAILRQLVEAALGTPYTPVTITNQHGSIEELARFMGAVRELEVIFRHAKSRLTAAPPILPDDAEAMKEWREDRATVDAFFNKAAACLDRMTVVAALLGSLDATTIEKLRRFKREAIAQAEKERLAEKHVRAEYFTILAAWLEKAGL